RAGRDAEERRLGELVRFRSRVWTWLAADREHVAGAQRRRAEPAKQVGRSAAEHRCNVDAAAHADVGPHAAGKGADRELVARLRIERRELLGAGDRDEGGREEAQTRSGERALERRRAV